MTLPQVLYEWIVGTLIQVSWKAYSSKSLTRQTNASGQTQTFNGLFGLKDKRVSCRYLSEASDWDYLQWFWKRSTRVDITQYGQFKFRIVLKGNQACLWQWLWLGLNTKASGKQFRPGQLIGSINTVLCKQNHRLPWRWCTSDNLKLLLVTNNCKGWCIGNVSRSSCQQ